MFFRQRNSTNISESVEFINAIVWLRFYILAHEKQRMTVFRVI